MPPSAPELCVPLGHQSIIGSRERHNLRETSQHKEKGILLKSLPAVLGTAALCVIGVPASSSEQNHVDALFWVISIGSSSTDRHQARPGSIPVRVTLFFFLLNLIFVLFIFSPSHESHK